MSSFRKPVGSQPNSVYWRRRATVFGAVLVVVVVVVLIVVGRGGGASSAAPTNSAASTRSATPTADADRARETPKSTATTSPAASATTTTTATAPAPATAAPNASAKNGAVCQKSQIVLKPVLDKTAYGPTEEPKIAMSISNTASSSCHMDLGSAQQVLTITSGAETYWTSKDCQTGGTDQDVTLKAGQTLTTPAIAWDRTRSSTTTCDASRPSVSAGGASYHLEVAVGNITSTVTAQFVLS